MKKIKIADILIYAFCILVALILIVPFYNVVIRSVATQQSIVDQGFYLIPTSFDLTAYKTIIEGGRMLHSFGISTLVTVVGTLFSILLTLCGGYVFSRRVLPGRQFLLILILITMFFNGGLIPYYMNIKSLHLVNNLLVLILPSAVNTFYLIIMINYFKSIPESLEESAMIDGANNITILFKIMVPISKPTIAAISLFYAVDYWNDWWKALLFITDEKKYPMQLFLREMLVDVSRIASSSMASSMVTTFRQVAPESLKMATVLITMAPIIVIYPLIQKHFAAGAMVGSVKG